MEHNIRRSHYGLQDAVSRALKTDNELVALSLVSDVPEPTTCNKLGFHG